jgi:type II secretory pathway pseudopilin PulG
MGAPRNRLPPPRLGLGRAGSGRGDGFAYLGLLIMVAIIGVASTATLRLGSALQQQGAEEELLDIGSAFRNALLSYANATPAGQPRAPRVLEDLLKDPRYPSTRRHLRKLYTDPMTGNQDWGTVASPEGGGGIVGVYSLSNRQPLKIGNFDAEFQDFDGKTAYSDWKFIATPAVLPPGAAAEPASPSAPPAAPPSKPLK